MSQEIQELILVMPLHDLCDLGGVSATKFPFA